MDSHHRPSDYKYQPFLLLKLPALSRPVFSRTWKRQH